MPNDGKIKKINIDMIDPTGGTAGDGIVVNSAGNGLEYGAVASSGGGSSGGTTIQTGGGGPVIISYGWDTNQDWDQPGIEKTGIQHPSLSGELRTAELTGLFVENYTSYTDISAQTDTELDIGLGQVSLEAEIDFGDGSDGDFNLDHTNATTYGYCGAGNIESIGGGLYEEAGLHHGSIYNYASGSYATKNFGQCWRLEQLTSTTATIDYSVLNTDYVQALVRPGTEWMIYCAQAPAGASGGDLDSVGRYEFVRVKSVDINAGLITFTKPKTRFYGEGGNTDNKIGGPSYSNNQRYIVFFHRVHNFANVTMGSTDDNKDCYMFPKGGFHGTDTNNHYAGIIIFRCSDTLTIDQSTTTGTLGYGSMHVKGYGYTNTIKRHSSTYTVGTRQHNGNSIIPPTNFNYNVTSRYARNFPANHSGGGIRAGSSSDSVNSIRCGGGANHAFGDSSTWSTFTATGGTPYRLIIGGSGLLISANLDDDDKLFYGGGGGVHSTIGTTPYGQDGGGGSGIIYICAKNIVFKTRAAIDGSGGDGTSYSSTSEVGGGGGGTVFLKCKNFTNYSTVAVPVDVAGGDGSGSQGGDGGHGRCVIQYENWTGATWTSTDLIRNQIVGIYKASGTLTSTNVLSSSTVTSIDDFIVYVADLPPATTLKVRFSQDGQTWYNSASSSNQYTTLTGSGEQTISLSTLNWTTSSFYYEFTFSTTDTDYTPVVTSTSVDYTPTTYQANGIWTSQLISYGAFWLHPRTIKSIWSSDNDAPYPKFQLIGDDTTQFNSTSAVTLPAPGYYYQDGSAYDFNNNTELEIEEDHPYYRKYWKVKVYLDAGTDVTDTPTVRHFFLSTTSSVTPSAFPGGWSKTGTNVHLATSTDKVGIGTNTPDVSLDIDADSIRVRDSQTVPTSASTGFAGEIAWDANYLYVCTSTDTWKRLPLSGW